MTRRHTLRATPTPNQTPMELSRDHSGTFHLLLSFDELLELNSAMCLINTPITDLARQKIQDHYDRRDSINKELIGGDPQQARAEAALPTR